MNRYTVYGNLEQRDPLVLAATLGLKGLDFECVEESASLSYALSARSGSETGPYLRTPDGFVLSDIHAMLEWLERNHPDASFFPATPIRRSAARLIEDWLQLCPSALAEAIVGDARAPRSPFAIFGFSAWVAADATGLVARSLARMRCVDS